jgi:hypothetical protein
MGFFDSLFKPSTREVPTVTTGYQRSTSTTSLPDWQLPYIQAQLKNVAAMPGYQPYTGELQAPRSQVATAAENYALANAARGSPALNAAQGYTTDVLGGKFLGANPYLDAAFSQAADRLGEQFRKVTAPGIAANFSLGGRYGSGAQREALATQQQQVGDQLRRLATDIYGSDYARERANMEAAAGRAPGLTDADYIGARVLGNLGTAADAYADNPIVRALQLYQFGQTTPWTQEAARAGILGGDYGRSTTAEGSSNTTTKETVYGPSPFATGLGMASAIGKLFLPFF